MPKKERLKKIKNYGSMVIWLYSIIQMFIQRKSTQFSKKSQKSLKDLPHIVHRHPQKNVQIIQYPVIQFFISLIFIALSIYFIYSVSGGANSIQGFNNQKWWQYILALIPSVFGIAFMISCQTETIYLSRRQNKISIQKKQFFCIESEAVEKEFSDLVGLSIVKRGTEKINFTSSAYYIVLSFKTCDEIQILGSKSSLKILEYFEEIRKIFDEDEISQKRVVIRNLIDQS